MASAPQVTVPNYIDLRYHIPPQYSLDQNRIKTIGSKINPIYAAGQKWTPAQKKRAFAITCLAIAALFTLTAAILTATTGFPLALVCVVIGLVGCVFSATALKHIKPDLDDPKTRNSEMAKIARLHVDKIITTPSDQHGVDNILGYALLDRITGPKNPHLTGVTPDARDVFYDSFAHLATSFLSIRQQKNDHAALIDQTFNDAVAPLDKWRHDRIAEIEQLKQAGNSLQQATRVNQPARRHQERSGPPLLRRAELAGARRVAVAGQDARRGNQRNVAPVVVAPTPYDVAGRDAARGNHSVATSVPYSVAGSAKSNGGDVGSRAVEVAGGIANFAIQVGSQLTEAQVRQTYADAVAPLEKWKVTTVAQEFSAYDGALKLLNLNSKYQQIHTDFITSNYQAQATPTPYRAPVTIPAPQAAFATPSAPPQPTPQPAFAPHFPPPPPYDGDK